MQRNRVSKKKILSIAACAIIGLHSHAQDTSENRRALYGKWKVCIDTQFSKSYSCDNPYTSYTILPMGSMKRKEMFYLVVLDFKLQVNGRSKIVR